MDNIALFLDVDGVLNQYRRCERIRRHKIEKRNNFKDEFDTFKPFQKKVKRLAKLVKKYDIDVYVFSAWTIENLQPHVPFELKGDTRKHGANVNEIAKLYKHNILIDDEASVIFDKSERYNIDRRIAMYQPHYDYGLVLKDFKRLDYILKGLI